MCDIAYMPREVVALAESDEAVYRHYLATGSEDDLRVLLERYREGLTLFANGTVRDLDEAEEVMLDTLAVVASGTARFDGRSSFRTWLFSIARKLAVSRVRRFRFLLEPLEDQPDESSQPLDFQILSEDRNRVLYRALDGLTPDYRQVLYLLFFEDMSVEDAARVMRKSVKQVYNLSYRGKQALRDELTRMGFTDADV